MDGGITIFWSTTAKNQRDLIFKFWNKRNGNTGYSKKLNLKLRERTKLLKQHPKVGRKTTFPHTRAISMGNYMIFYKYLHPIITITAFWDNRQDPEKLRGILRNV